MRNTLMEDDVDSETKAQARRWLAEVDAAYDDGGYAAGDGPRAPVEEVRALLAEVDRLRVGLAEIAGRHDGHDHECSQCMAARLLDAR